MAEPLTPTPVGTPVESSTVGVDPDRPHSNGRPGRNDSGRATDHDPYLGVLLVLIVAAAAGILGARWGWGQLYLKAFIDAGVTLGVLAGVLVGVIAARAARAAAAVELEPLPATLPSVPPAAPLPPGRRFDWARVTIRVRAQLVRLPGILVRGLRAPLTLKLLRIAVALGGLGAMVVELRALEFSRPPFVLPVVAMGLGALVLAGLAATAAEYLAGLDPVRLPEAAGLARAARTIAWVLVVVALSAALKWVGGTQQLGWLGTPPVLRGIHLALVAVNAAICVNLLCARVPAGATGRAALFPTDLLIFTALGARWNPIASVLDQAERQLGIDLRSTWAVAVVRQSVEPLLAGLLLCAWLATAVTVVGVQEEGLVERLGVPVGGAPLASGLHFHLPWPIDRVYRIPTLRVQAIAIGNESALKTGPEDVIWTVQHVADEFTLLLGDGRDLITVDGTLQYRIVDARAWRYHSQNPETALRALAFRAVMRNTVNLTLSDALSENVVALTGRMRDMVQEEADRMGLGVQVVGLTIAGMHPPVAVADAYEGVISAQIKGTTAVVDAQAYRNEALPGAQTFVVGRTTRARTDGAEGLGLAAGEAWAFRTLLAQYQAAPAEFQFRRKLETLEKDLAGRKFTVLDARFTRDGGEVWIEP